MAPLTTKRGSRINVNPLALPAFAWLILFFLLPLLIVFFVSFLTRGQGGAGVWPPTIEHYDRVFSLFWPIIWRSLMISLLTTLICLLVGYPLAFFISTRKNKTFQQITLFMILLPFWTNFLVRTYALQTILGREGIINSVLMNFSLITEPLTLLNTPFATTIGLVYGFLPFMVLPIYASVERLDFRLVEAAYDLGANDWHAFWRVVLPVTLPGVIAGCALVFIPTIGAFVTPDLLGGRSGLMIGNLIQNQFGGRGNMPLGAALSIVLMAIVLISVIIYIRFGDEGD